jgi:glycosyltransferase involved in cell wall biosynthesis
VKFLTEYLKENPVDAIVSTGPPHSMHMIALGIKKRLNIPWLADFRDPWTNIDFYRELKLLKFADKKHRKMEQAVLKYADLLTTVSKSWAGDFRKLGAENMEVVTNGFDEEDFLSLESTYYQNDSFEICHIGAMNKDRNPVKLWKTIAEICKDNSEFSALLKITFIGQTDISVKRALQKCGLMEYAGFENYKPHDEVLGMAARASVLLLALNDTPNVEGIIPGKLFEYLAMKTPILCIGSVTGDSAAIINETRSGVTVDFSDEWQMKLVLQNLFADFKNKPGQTGTCQNIEKYTRKSITLRMAELLNKMVASG